MEQETNLSQRELQIIELLLQGCENSVIGEKLGMAPRTVKFHFNKLFLKFEIKSGYKRVKLATFCYKRRQWLLNQIHEVQELEKTEDLAVLVALLEENNKLLDLLHQDTETLKLRELLGHQNTSLKTTLQSSSTRSVSGTELSWLYGMCLVKNRLGVQSETI